MDAIRTFQSVIGKVPQALGILEAVDLFARSLHYVAIQDNGLGGIGQVIQQSGVCFVCVSDTHFFALLLTRHQRERSSGWPRHLRSKGRDRDKRGEQSEDLHD